jgi:PAS domain S-box-containing protein
MLGLMGLAAHVFVLSGCHPVGVTMLWSNLSQLALGILAVLATLEAASRSSHFGRRMWLLAALATGIYTIGQATFTYGWAHGQPPSPLLAMIYDPIFFFWVVPLVAGAVTDPAEIAAGFELSSILDISLLVLLALAMHFSAFFDGLHVQAHPEEGILWRFKVRLVRDLIVLACLWGRYFFSHGKQVRAIFRRLGLFYLAYACCNVVFVLASSARHSTRPGSWVDLSWSIPRLLAIILAATWNWPGEIAAHAPSTTKWRRYVLEGAPLVVPLLVLAVSWRMFSASPWIWGIMITATLVLLSLRLRLSQFRHNSAVARLNTSTNLLHSIIEGTSEAVYLKDAEGRYLLMNSAGARLLGQVPEDIVGKTDHEIFPAIEADLIRQRDQTIITSGQEVTCEDVLTSAGSPRRYLTTKNPYRDAEGRIIGVLGISADITERRRIEEHLQKTQRMESIGTFSSGIAHDFNNLLTVIKGYSYLAHADADGNSAVRESVDQINKATARAASLIEQLLAFTRRQILQPRVINLNDTISNFRRMLDRLIGDDVRIQTELAADLCAVKADPGQIEQVLMNLATNARDAMPAGGTLTLETANVDLHSSNCGPDFHVPPGSYVCLAITDTGNGMDAYTRSRIFEPFFTTKPAGKGTGLGLATVYGIIKQSGGYLSVESEPEAGATFRVYLPCVNEPVESLAQAVPLATPGAGHQTILVVDNDSQVRQLATKILTNSGFRVLEAEGGEQAERLASLHQGAIDMLLTDVVMPGASGCEVARNICRGASKPRVVYMSGYPGQTIAQHGMLNPGICLLQKPFSPARLVEKVKEVLAPVNGSPAVVPELLDLQSRKAG